MQFWSFLLDDDLKVFLSTAKLTGKNSSNEHLGAFKLPTRSPTTLTNPTGLDCDSTGLERGGWVGLIQQLWDPEISTFFLETSEKYRNFTDVFFFFMGGGEFQNLRHLGNFEVYKV